MQGTMDLGRITIEFVVANNRDVVRYENAGQESGKAKRLTVSGVVDSGAARLVLPQRVADELQLQVDGEAMVRYADHRREKRPLVSNVWLEIQGRHGVFSAVVEPHRDDALIGAIVLEELDLLVDCATQSLCPREPDAIVAQIE